MAGLTDSEKLTRFIGLLPPEVLNEIVNLLTIDQKKCMRLVCKNWRDEIDSRLDVIFNVTLTNTTAKWINENTKYSRIGSLKVEEFTSEIEFTIFEPITVISAVCFGQGNSKQNFEQVVALCLEKNVQKLVFGQNSVPSDVNKDNRWILPSVHSLDIRTGVVVVSEKSVNLESAEESGSEMLDFLKTLFIFPSLQKVSIHIVNNVGELEYTEKLDEYSDEIGEDDEDEEDESDDEEESEPEPKPSTSNAKRSRFCRFSYGRENKCGHIKKPSCYKCSRSFNRLCNLKRHLVLTNCVKPKAVSKPKKPKRCGKGQERRGEPLNVKTRAQVKKENERIAIAEEKKKERIAHAQEEKLDRVISVVTKLIFGRTFGFLNEQKGIKSLSLTIPSDIARLMIKPPETHEIVPIHCPTLEEIELNITRCNYNFVIPHLLGCNKLKKLKVHSLSPLAGWESERLTNQLIQYNLSSLESITLDILENQINTIQLQNCSSLKELDLFLHIAHSAYNQTNQNQPEFRNFPRTLRRLKLFVAGREFQFEFDKIQNILKSIKEGVEEFVFNPRIMYFGMRNLKWILSLPKVKKVVLVDIVPASGEMLAQFCQKQIPGSKSTFSCYGHGPSLRDTNGDFSITITEWEKKLYLN